MKYYEVKRTIAAPPERIWRVLTDAVALVEGNTGITRIDGNIALNEKIKLVTEVSPRAFALKVTEFEPDRRMVWQGGMPLGLFKGVREFNLTLTDDGTEFHMREEFSGPMLGLIWKSMPDLGPSFEQFADALHDMTRADDT